MTTGKQRAVPGFRIVVRLTLDECPAQHHSVVGQRGVVLESPLEPVPVEQLEALAIEPGMVDLDDAEALGIIGQLRRWDPGGMCEAQMKDQLFQVRSRTSLMPGGRAQVKPSPKGTPMMRPMSRARPSSVGRNSGTLKIGRAHV